MAHKAVGLVFFVTVFQRLSGNLFNTINDKHEELMSKVEYIKSQLNDLTKQKFPKIPPMDFGDFKAFMDIEDIFGFSSETDDEQRGWPFERVQFNNPIQSPVDIITSKAVTKKLPLLDIIEPVQQDVKAKFYNSGSTVYIYIEEKAELRPYLTGGPLKGKYIFKQIHFHWGSEDVWGSEHFVDGESFAVEIHGVYFNSKYSTFNDAKDKEDGLVVLAIFAEAKNETNPLLEPLHSLLPNVTLAGSSVLLDSGDALQWAASALSLNTEYYTYPGSLTTKPFTENVVFIVFPKPITLSHGQLQAFREIEDGNKTCIVDNKRKLQPLHNRPLVRGTDLQ